MHCKLLNRSPYITIALNVIDSSTFPSMKIATKVVNFHHTTRELKVKAFLILQLNHSPQHLSTLKIMWKWVITHHSKNYVEMWKCKTPIEWRFIYVKDIHTTLLTSQTILTTRQETNQMPISIHFDRAKDTHSMDHTWLRVEHIIYAWGKDIHTIILQMIHTHHCCLLTIVLTIFGKFKRIWMLIWKWRLKLYLI